MNRDVVIAAVDQALECLEKEREKVPSAFVKGKLDTYFLLALNNVKAWTIDGTITLNSSAGHGLVRATGEWDGFSSEFVNALSKVEDALQAYAKSKGL
jgi:hypothetical protein